MLPKVLNFRRMAALPIFPMHFTWAAYRAFRVLENWLGAADAAAIVATVLWGRILDAPEGVFTTSLDLFFRAGVIERFDNAWKQYLAHRKDYVPDYWHFLVHAKTIRTSSHADLAIEVVDYLRVAGREELVPLIEVYLLQMRQTDSTEVFDAALALTEPTHRAQVAEFMTGMGYMAEELRNAVSIYRNLAKGTSLDPAAISLMEARLATADGKWTDVIDFAKKTNNCPKYRYAGELLYANALANLGQTHEAREKLNAVTKADDAGGDLHARAEFINVTVELIEKGVALPNAKEIPKLRDMPGRPLAQSLWVGRRLRWIERLAIKSYLNNGWRFQLYVYEDPDNVPEGCEVLDANAIIPHREVFREGQNSGLHAGSVGAFSDLFRYRLLHLRGGMWTDTDVINFQKFDPDGERFISTEIADGGLVTLNGAIMAAPAGDKFVGRAYDRARELLSSDDMFFTRIGPYLLAEILREVGVENVNLMPPNFLSAVYWMNTATLLKPYDVVIRRPEMQDIVNLHIYTEMWRVLGLGLESPPTKETFLGKLYADHFGDENAELSVVGA